MFSHVMVGTNDVERSKRFYDALFGEGRANAGRQGPLAYRAQRRDVHGHPADRRRSRRRTATARRSASISTARKRSTPGTTRASPPAARRSRTRPAIARAAFGKLYLAYLRDPDGNKLCGLHRPSQMTHGDRLREQVARRAAAGRAACVARDRHRHDLLDLPPAAGREAAASCRSSGTCPASPAPTPTSPRRANIAPPAPSSG